MWTWIFLVLLVVVGGAAAVNGTSLSEAASSVVNGIPRALSTGATLGMTLVALFLINFLILFGPLVFLGIQQIKAYEPGEADWGVKLGDVRGQAEAREEITRVVALWQSGEEFERQGGKRERGVLFLGAPGSRARCATS